MAKLSIPSRIPSDEGRVKWSKININFLAILYLKDL